MSGIAESPEERRLRTLFVRYKKKRPPEEDIRMLHPKVVDVRLPRQKSARFCHLLFANQEIAIEAMTVLKKNKGVVVMLPRGPRKPPVPARHTVAFSKSLLVLGLPADVEEDQLLSHFPNCVCARPLEDTANQEPTYLCTFVSEAAASDTLVDRSLWQLDSNALTLSFAPAEAQSPELKKKKKKEREAC